MPLTAKQERFCEEYMVDSNASAAYARAGYSAKNADVNSAMLMVKHSIKEQIAGLRAELSEVVNNRRADILKETKRIAYAPNSPTVSTGDKLRALELCGKECEGGIWTDKIGGGVDQAPPLTPEQAARYTALARAENIRLSKEDHEKTA